METLLEAYTTPAAMTAQMAAVLIKSIMIFSLLRKKVGGPCEPLTPHENVL
jgi:hypothetical protein